MKELAIGIDIGGTGTKFGLTDREGNILVSERITTNARESFDEYLTELHDSIKKMLSAVGYKGSELTGLDIGAPNGNYFNGTIDDAPNLRWRGILDFVDEFKKYYDVPMILTNDANAAALGEMLFGAAALIWHDMDNENEQQY